MHLSRINIQNFRNFKCLDARLAGNVAIVGENGVGKSNLLFALRLIFDASLPDSARQLGLDDFYDGLDELNEDTKIVVSVEIKDFEDDFDVLALLTDFRLAGDPHTVRLTYEFRPRAGLDGTPTTSDDYEFVCFGGEDETRHFGHNLRRRITMDLLPALRDAEGDLAAWRRSPLRPLLERAFRQVDREDLQPIQTEINAATARLEELDVVKDIERELGELSTAMSGPAQAIEPGLGLASTDVTRLYRNIKLLIDGGRRTISDASLGSANIVFLSLKLLELHRLIHENRRDHTFLAIEEPEAHLHPHLQRSVYRHLFEEWSGAADGGPLSIAMTTHSPHIASVAPLRSILLLKNAGAAGTVAHSAADLELTTEESDDLARYLDVTRAEMLFASGIILVEGDAEKFLLPVFAEMMGYRLDHLGITICSVAGTNFIPYAKFLVGMGIPFSVITDWDPLPGRIPLGVNRAIKLVQVIGRGQAGADPDELLAELRQYAADTKWDDFDDRCTEHGVFTNVHTLEVDLFNSGYAEEIIATLREQRFGPARQQLIDTWEQDPSQLDVKQYLDMIESIGKGRFAQRLASRLADMGMGIDMGPPEYIQRAIRYVVSCV